MSTGKGIAIAGIWMAVAVATGLSGLGIVGVLGFMCALAATMIVAAT